MDNALKKAINGMMEPEGHRLWHLVDNEHFKEIVKVADELHEARLEVDRMMSDADAI